MKPQKWYQYLFVITMFLFTLVCVKVTRDMLKEKNPEKTPAKVEKVKTNDGFKSDL